MSHKKSGIETRLAHEGEDRLAHQGAVVPPLYQNSLFVFRDWDDIDAAFSDRTSRPIYTRLTNPTTLQAEQKIAALAGDGYACRLAASGMGAVSAAVLNSVSQGDHIVAVKNIYGLANNLVNRYLAGKMGISVTFVPGDDPAQFEAAITERTKLIMLESPSSAVFGLQDIPAVVAIAQKHGIRTMIDNTWATPLWQKCLDMGVDIEVHSCSKYLGGHSDIVAGAIVARPEIIHDIIVNESELLGATIAPHTAWLLIRSLRTLPTRLRSHAESARAVAEFLDSHPAVKQVHWPGLESHPQHVLAQRQLKGFTGLMSFTLATEDLAKIKAFVNALRIFQIGVSWGGHESLVYAPAISYLKELPPERFADLGISLGDIRISVGLETLEDVLADLGQALEKAS